MDGNASIDGSTFVVDSTNDRVGIGTTSPGVKLDIVGDARTSDSLTLSGTTRTASQGILFTGDTNLYLSAADMLKNR